MKSLLQRASLYASAAMITGLVKVSAYANNGGFAGPTPNIGTPEGQNAEGIRGIIVSIIKAVLNFLALIAVVVIIIAGIRLIVSQGEEEQKEKAKKAIFYALIGLIIVLFARVIVGLITEYLATQVGNGNATT